MSSALAFAGRETLRLAFLLAAVSVVAFTLVSLSPVDPVSAYIGDEVLRISPEQRQIIAERWGLDAPAPVRYLRWAGQIAQGHFGTSMVFNEPVLSVIGSRALVSLALMAVAWSLSGVLGFALGLVAGAFEGTWLDRAVRGYSYTLASTPSFWLGLVLLSVFAVGLRWAPIGGASPIGVPFEAATLGERLAHLALPALALSVIGVAGIALHTREKVVDAMHSDYALFARAQGETRWGVAQRHAFRNALLPALTLQLGSLGELFGGAVLAETVFSYPGLGQATVQAGLRGDVPLLLGITLFATLFVFTGNALADASYRFVDPRIRLGASPS